MALTGVQILFGFLLALSFSARFESLDALQRAVFVATMSFAMARKLGVPGRSRMTREARAS